MAIPGVSGEVSHLVRFGEDGVAFCAAGDKVVLVRTDAISGAIRRGVLTNDTDPEGQPLTAIQMQGPQHGQLTWNGDGTFTYAPNRISTAPMHSLIGQ